MSVPTSIAPGQRGRCPHCAHFVVFVDGSEKLGRDAGQQFVVAPATEQRDGKAETLRIRVDTAVCPSCLRVVVDLAWVRFQPPAGFMLVRSQRLYPVTSSRPKPPAEVPQPLRRDYEEAAAVEAISARAAAALARRCLQSTLWDKGFKAANLVA